MWKEETKLQQDADASKHEATAKVAEDQIC
jgi:hypothetical protein